MRQQQVDYATSGLSDEPDEAFYARLTQALRAKQLELRQAQDDTVFVVFEGQAVALSSDEQGMLCYEHMGSVAMDTGRSNDSEARA